jgi:hypothetical protein
MIEKHFIQSLTMNKTLFISACILIFWIDHTVFSQTEEKQISIMFWNVENLFDPFGDSLTLDEEFTPEGAKHWTWIRFRHKLNNIYKVIAMAGEWNPPDIIGLCEVENRWVLEELVRNTPLSKYEYRIIHYDSPDPRGIDVCMLYLPGSFRLLYAAPLRVTGLKPGDEPARDILYVKGLIRRTDTLHLFINHWPSRYQGIMVSAHKRLRAAEILKQYKDSLFRLDPGNRIIIFGDFNDEPSDQSLSEILRAENICGDIEATNLYNLAIQTTGSFPGTQKYQGKWYMFDQFIISGNLFNEYDSCLMKVLDFDFLLEKDESYVGLKPFRTYNGYHYKGGFSDHLPVMLKISFK